MYYFEVLVRSAQYHGKGPLTYEYPELLNAGSIVSIPLRKERVPGIVVRRVPKPQFATKPILSHAVSLPPLPPHMLQLILWLQDYYPAPLGQILGLILPNAAVATLDKQAAEIEVHEQEYALPEPFQLTREQQAAVATITGKPGPVLLHGDTATGKTRVYMEAIRQNIAAGKSAIILTPEIGLTPQLQIEIEQHFPNRVVVLHSTQSPKQRRGNWLQALCDNKPKIIVGPRSALFCPVNNLGIVILDEAHDQAFKQEQSPHYVTSRVAAQLCRLTSTTLVMGTATPAVVDYHAFKTKNLPIVRMKQLAISSNKVINPPEVIDLKNRQLFSRSAWLSDAMIRAVEAALGRGEQSLVFLNRRGSARLILCSSCGWQADCPRCDIPLTFHGDNHILRCHTCGLTQAPPTTCPECGSPDILFKSIGTKAIVTELERLFPEAPVVRFDSDLDKSERLESRYSDLHSGAAMIIVGTQLISKGLDLPNLSVVGVVIADTALTFPDYSAEERSYQLLTQVIGRSQRGHQNSTTIIQTYHPDHPTLQAAVTKDYVSFYESQIKERSTYQFPPFCHLLKLTVHRSRAKTAQSAAEQLTITLKNSKLCIEVIGPSPSFKEKRGDQYYWQIVIKSRRRPEILKVLDLLPANWQYDLDPLDLL